MKILVTAIGKRVQLIKHLRQSFEVIGVDITHTTPASFFVDKFIQIPRYTDESYVDKLIEICKEHGIDILIPLMELEFIKLSKARKDFKSIGTTLLLSNSTIIELCNNKKKTAHFFYENQISAPQDNTDESTSTMHYPVIIKPYDGMGSQNVFKVKNEKELLFFKEYIPNHIIEEYIEGEEYTVDVLCDFIGQPIYIIPRLRLEVRAGEVSKSRIVKDNSIIEATKILLEKLNGIKEDGIGIMGPLTIQCFKKKDGKIVFLEINPRFGGGVPLSFEAGANYAEALQCMLKGENIPEREVKELTMLRYDEAVFTKE